MAALTALERAEKWRQEAEILKNAYPWVVGIRWLWGLTDDLGELHSKAAHQFLLAEKCTEFISPLFVLIIQGEDAAQEFASAAEYYFDAKEFDQAASYYVKAANAQKKISVIGKKGKKTKISRKLFSVLLLLPVYNKKKRKSSEQFFLFLFS